MNKDEARAVLAKIKFLDFKLELRDTFHDQYSLLIKMNSPDTRDRTQRIRILHEQPIDLAMCRDEQMLIILIFECILLCLRHEAAELFFVGNVLLFDEHDDHNQKAKKQELIKAMFTNEQAESTGIVRQDGPRIP